MNDGNHAIATKTGSFSMVKNISPNPSEPSRLEESNLAIKIIMLDFLLVTLRGSNSGISVSQTEHL